MDLFLKFLVAAVAAGTPFLFGTVGEIVTEKTGHLNLGVEGIMAVGGCAGFMAGYATGSFALSLLAAFAAGALCGWIYAVLTVTFMANQNVTGLALTTFGSGLANFFGVYALSTTQAKSLLLDKSLSAFMKGTGIPGLKSIPVVGTLLFSYSPFVYLGVVVAVLCGLYYRRTQAGLNIQAIGENPRAADAAGIPVNRLKYINIMAGGGICGIGGAYCSMMINEGKWISNNIGGLGWIAVALVIFVNWNPLAAIGGSFLFGALRVLKYYVPAAWFTLPMAFYDMLPFLITALVLIFSSMRKHKRARMPSALGVNYFREDR